MIFNRLERKKVMVFLLFVLMVTLAVAANASANESPQAQNSSEQESIMSTLYPSWLVAVDYKYKKFESGEDIVEHQVFQPLSQLRGSSLRYLLDSLEIINMAQNDTFPASPLDASQQVRYLSSEQEQEIVMLVASTVFDTEQDGLVSKFDPVSLRYYTLLESSLRMVVEDTADEELFSDSYLAYREMIVQFVNDTNTDIFTPSQSDYAVAKLEHYLEAQDSSVDVYFPQQRENRSSCPTVHTIDNWPAKDNYYAGNTGSSWHEGRASTQNDCDYFIRYFTGGLPNYGIVSPITGDTLCVLNKISQLTGSHFGNFNNIQYGKKTVTWSHPFGCSTTANSVRANTKWRTD